MTLALSSAEMVTEVRDALSRRQDILDARIYRALNIGQERVFRKPVHWPELERFREVSDGLSASTETFDLNNWLIAGDTFHDIFSLRVRAGVSTEWYKLRLKSPRVWDKYTDSVTAGGYPQWYTLWGTMISVYPTYDMSLDLRLRYKRVPSKITPTEGTVFADKTGIIIAFAISHIQTGLSKPNEAARWYTVADNQLREAMMNVRGSTDEISLTEGEYTSNEPWNDPFVRAY